MAKDLVDSAITQKQVAYAGVASRVLEVPGAGPPILLIHGFTDSADTWRLVLDELAALGRRAIAVDLPGHGLAELAPRPIVPGFDRFVAEFVQDHAGEGPVILAGNSLGGLLSLRAATDPDLPLAVAVGLGPAGLGYTREVPLLTVFSRLTNPFAGPFDRLPVSSRRLRKGALRVHRRLCEGRVIQPLADYFASHLDSMKTLAEMRRMLIDLGRVSGVDMLDVSAIRKPVLLLWGERDHLVPVTAAPVLLDVVPNSRLVVLDCGHMPQVQLPVQVARELAALSAG